MTIFFLLSELVSTIQENKILRCVKQYCFPYTIILKKWPCMKEDNIPIVKNICKSSTVPVIYSV